MGASSGATAPPDAPPVRHELDDSRVLPPFRQRLHQLLLGPPPGEEVECPKCGTVFPAPDEERAPRALKTTDDGDDSEATEPLPKRKKKKKRYLPILHFLLLAFA